MHIRFIQAGAVTVLTVALASGFGIPASAQSYVASPQLLAKISAGDFASAEAEVRASLRQNPASGRAQFLLGYILFRELRYTDSLAAYTAGAKTETPSADDLVTVASDYIQLRSYADAVRWLTYVTEHAPQNQAAWYLLGRSQFLLDHPAEALTAFEHCLALRPKYLPAKYNAGLALERLQRPVEAEAAYRQAIAWADEQQSIDPQPWLDLGNLLLSHGDAREAVRVLTTAASKAPRNPTCQQQLGVALAAAGNHSAAVEPLRKAIDLAPKAQRPHFYLGKSLRALGRKEEADAEFALVARLLAAHEDEETPNPDASPSIGGGAAKNLD